ncbi:MAG: type II 3-dehydroquinate dehydratase [Saprospiraceae bacterium]|nr:type II 3-dehydroquinate dehydratase [Saprospiraceae bacterium]
MSVRIAIINGPNLNLVGTREPEIYGNRTFDEILDDLRKDFSEITLEYYQSNHEGQLIDWLHMLGFLVDGIVLNPGGYSHTSIALRDAVAAVTSPVVEVHISDIKAREPFRHHSYLEDVCATSIIGRGVQGYAEAIQFLLGEQDRD